MLSVADFDSAIRENEVALLGYFQRRIFNAADAADAYSELLLTAWRSRRRMPEDATAARMWLFGVARNVSRNTQRTLARRSAAAQRFRDAVVDESPEADERGTELREAITLLSDQDAELIRLIYWDGFTSHDAAMILNINPSTARSRLATAKATLRMKLAQQSQLSGEHNA